MELRPILDICDRETGYEEGGRRREPWWRQTADRKQLSATLEDILASARAWCWESVRHGEGGEGREVTEYDEGRDGTNYNGIEKGDARVGKRDCVETRQPERDIGKGHERVAPPRQTSGGR